jgi:hypothetical protein
LFDAYNFANDVAGGISDVFAAGSGIMSHYDGADDDNDDHDDNDASPLSRVFLRRPNPKNQAQ